ncbi:MAG: (Fe-S)-binding protein [Candidatus Thorarchaeota archaeon]
MATSDINALREELLQCRRCGICRNAVYEARGFDGICPVWKNGGGFETDFMRGKIVVALALLSGQLDRSSENMESLFRCTLCGNCAQICPAGFNPTKSLETVRSLLSDVPIRTRDEIADRIMHHDNPYTEDSADKRAWVSRLGFEAPRVGEFVYFAGCTSALRLPEVALNTARILRAAGIDFAVMEDEPCCGSVMLRTGRLSDAKSNAMRVAEKIHNTGASTIVVSCAGCLKTLREDLSHMGIGIPRVVHITELALELIREGRLTPRISGQPMRVTYHDPCHLGRGTGIYEEPREILKAIAGIDFVEMETNRGTAMCCGAGGGVRAFDSQLALKIASDRIRTAERTGATHLVTACPFCEHNLSSGRNSIGSALSVVDITELLAQCLEEDDRNHRPGH